MLIGRETVMPSNEDSPDGHTEQLVWQSQKGDKEGLMTIATTASELSAMAQSREKLNTRLAWLFSIFALGIALALLYNIYRIEQPWIRVGQAWTLGVVAWLFLGELTRHRRRVNPVEASAEFLRLQHEERRRGYLQIRKGIFLFVPGVAACWWGGHSLVNARSPWLGGLTFAPWLFLLVGAGLVLVWIAFGKAAEKAALDRDDIFRS